MTRSFVFLLVSFVLVPTVGAFQAEPLAEKFLHAGKFVDGEQACLLALDATPADDEVRFGLGVIQFLRAIEDLGQSMYEYGAVSEKASQAFLRLPVPKNPKPSSISYTELGRVLDSFAADLRRAESTLAAIKDDDVKLRLRLAQISFDFAGTGEDQTKLLDLFVKLNRGQPFAFQKDNPDFRIHFDRGDVAWLRSYCHVLCAMVEAYRSIDQEVGFAQRVERVFPNVEPVPAVEKWWSGLKVVDAPRLRRARIHLLSVCELNRESWRHIRAEADDDFEWLSHPGQKDQLGLPLTDRRITEWLAMMQRWEGLLKGQTLLSGDLISLIFPKHDRNFGLNLKKVLDDPPADLLNYERIVDDGVDAKYLDLEKGRETIGLQDMINMSRVFSGPLGFAYAARLN